MDSIRIGTRRSDLARWQAHHVSNLIKSIAPEVETKLILSSSAGDRDRKSDFQAFAETGVFTKESQAALRSGEVDLVVHSLKDLPTVEEDELVLAAVPEREACEDVLVTAPGVKLGPGHRLGTGSVRRRAQALVKWPGIEIVPIRGNVPLRRRKAAERQGMEATILAKAGLVRLEMMDGEMEELSQHDFPYAVGQGALGIETRRDNLELVELLQKIEDRRARFEVDAERRIMRALEAGCSLPVGISAHWETDGLRLRAVVTEVDGSRQIEAEATGGDDPLALGQEIAEKLLSQGAKAILERAQVR